MPVRKRKFKNGSPANTGLRGLQTPMVSIETHVNRIEQLSKQKEDENWDFRSFLKWCDTPPAEIDSIVHRLYQEASSPIDCRTCANCCREVQPVLNQEDIEKFSIGLGISAARFRDQYLVKDKDSEGYTFNRMPCPFLKDNLCIHYAHRPRDCVSYPHLHKKDFIFRLRNVIGNCSICPIVFSVYESLKSEIWHDRETGVWEG